MIKNQGLGSSPLTRGKRASQEQRGPGSGLIPAHAGKTFVAIDAGMRTTAHPRSRGENRGWRFRSLFATGSSPLTRGKHTCLLSRCEIERLIPAHAGKTCRMSCGRGWAWAHPRSRGENVLPARGWASHPGSSPLTRGKHFLTCAFTAQIDQILETLELAASFGSYLIWVACATDAPQDPVRSIGLVLPSSRGAS